MSNKLITYNGKILTKGGGLIKKQQLIQTLNVENANSIELKDLGLIDLGDDNFLDFNGTYYYEEIDEGDELKDKLKLFTKL